MPSYLDECSVHDMILHLQIFGEIFDTIKNVLEELGKLVY